MTQPDRLPIPDLVWPEQDSRAMAIRRRRNTFRSHPAPTDRMSKLPVEWDPRRAPQAPVPAELEGIVNWFVNQPDARDRFRWALRDSLDELLDGQRTGRWAYQQLTKTEKTYLGTAVEVNLTKEFDIDSGDHLDWSVAGSDIDCKFSKDLGGWEIPMEMYVCAEHEGRSGRTDAPALLAWMSDDTSQWAAGLLVISDGRLRWREDKQQRTTVRAYNRDNKRRIASTVARDVTWLWGGLQPDLPTNLLLHLDPAARGRILVSNNSGQKRVDQLFREVQGRIIGRRVVLTVAQQDDPPKRARDARLRLRDEGILVLGHQDSHPHIAKALKLPVPVKGEWVAVRVVPVSESDPRPFVAVSGERWAVAYSDEAVAPAPSVPKRLET